MCVCVCVYIYIYIYRILVGMPEGKRLLGRPRRRWVDNIKVPTCVFLQFPVHLTCCVGGLEGHLFDLRLF
jgi:hypothetical protein